MHDSIFQIIAHALLAAFGAMARQLNAMNKDPLNVASFIGGCIIASFMGVIIYFITQGKIDNNITYAVAGISGWVGPRLMDTLAKLVMKAAGINIDDKDDKEGKEK